MSDVESVPMTLAYNLPNDIHAIRAAGSKLVMMKNVHEAKFHTILEKIASIAIDEDQGCSTSVRSDRNALNQGLIEKSVAQILVA